MAAYVVIEIKVQDPQTYDRYKELAPPAIAAYGGRYLVRGGRTETLEGSWEPSRLVVLEFPTLEKARGWWNSREYAAAKKLRQSCAHTEMVLVQGL